MFNIQTKLLAIGLLIAVSGALFIYHTLVVAAQEKAISELSQANVQLRHDVDTTVTANARLAANLIRLETQANQMQAVIASFAETTNAIHSYITVAKLEVNSPRAKKDLSERVTQDAVTALDEINRDIKCTLENFGRYGVCKKGVFVRID